jgi:hypothetical protein
LTDETGRVHTLAQSRASDSPAVTRRRCRVAPLILYQYEQFLAIAIAPRRGVPTKKAPVIGSPHRHEAPHESFNRVAPIAAKSRISAMTPARALVPADVI